jgi:hypothetical protein
MTERRLTFTVTCYEEEGRRQVASGLPSLAAAKRVARTQAYAMQSLEGAYVAIEGSDGRRVVAKQTLGIGLRWSWTVGGPKHQGPAGRKRQFTAQQIAAMRAMSLQRPPLSAAEVGRRCGCSSRTVLRAMAGQLKPRR